MISIQDVGNKMKHIYALLGLLLWYLLTGLSLLLVSVGCMLVIQWFFFYPVGAILIGGLIAWLIEVFKKKESINYLEEKYGPDLSNGYWGTK